ncbi:MAG: helix-turn-helix domain-containing protein [Micrococcales bacterium]|nr:helix-turn-helix domain-containing protein [Micrococcales bacterium]
MNALTVSPGLSDEELVRIVREREAAGQRVQIIFTEPFLTPAEAAEALGVSRTFVMNKITAGQIASTRRGTRHRIAVAEVERFRAVYIDQMTTDLAQDF